MASVRDVFLMVESILSEYFLVSINFSGSADIMFAFNSLNLLLSKSISKYSCEPILSGNAALQLGIITFNNDPNMFHPVLMIDNDAIGDEKAAPDW